LSLAYLGTSDFAASVLRRLAASPHRPELVVTRPDRPKGRGRRLQSPPVADVARELGLPLAQPEDVNAERFDVDELVVCAFGALVKDPLLSAQPILNVHPSLLPRWRGAAPIERAIMAGDDETGVSIMRLTAGLDSGPVCLAGREPIRADDTYGTLAERLERLGADLLIRALDERPPFREQPEEGVTYAEKIAAADRELPPGLPADELERIVRALNPHIGARIGDLGIRAARALEPGTGGLPGELTARDSQLLYGDLELLEVQPPGKRPMPAADYLRGHRAE
jgi:methionyl-tRNA formyltransferase